MILKNTNGRSTITLSLNSDILGEIRKSARFQNLSVNSFINNVLSKHTIFYKHVEEQKSVVLPTKIYSIIIKTMEQEKQIEFMKLFYHETILPIFAHNNIELTVDNIVKFCFEGIELWSGLYNSFSYHRDDNDNTVLVFEHKYGIKWSKIIGKTISEFIEDGLGCSTEQKIRQNVAVIKIFNKK